MVKLQKYTPARAREIADLFHQAVHTLPTTIYTQAQAEAWAPTPPDYQYWAHRLNTKQPMMALVDHQVVGFIELESDGHIDCLYVHPNFQRRGVATLLYEYAEAEAIHRRYPRLYVEASVIAKPFFERHGFATSVQNTIQIRGVALINYTMEKGVQVG